MQFFRMQFFRFCQFCKRNGLFVGGKVGVRLPDGRRLYATPFIKTLQKATCIEGVDLI